jgi:hypothetical protein
VAAAHLRLFQQEAFMSRQRARFTVLSAVLVVLFLLVSKTVFAEPSMSAESVFNDYTGGVVGYVLLAGALVVLLLGGGILMLNLGLLSKRKEDRRGVRAPSEPAILKSTIWPEVPEEGRTLPAEDDDEPIYQSPPRPGGGESEDFSVTSTGEPLSAQGVTREDRRLDKEAA